MYSPSQNGKCYKNFDTVHIDEMITTWGSLQHAQGNRATYFDVDFVMKLYLHNGLGIEVYDLRPANQHCYYYYYVHTVGSLGHWQ